MPSKQFWYVLKRMVYTDRADVTGFLSHFMTEILTTSVYSFECLKLKVNGPKKNAKNQTINTYHRLLEGA